MANPYLDQQDEERALLVPDADPAETYTPPEHPADVVAATPSPTLEAHGAPVAPLSVPDYSPKADRAALESAQQDRADKDVRATFEDAGSLFRQAFHGSAMGGEATRRTRDDAYQDVLRQRAAEDRDRELAKAQHVAAISAALAKGDSPESVSAKNAFGGTTVGAALRKQMGEDAWTRLPGSAIPGAKEQLSSETELLKSQLKAQGAAKTQSDDLDAYVKRKGGRGTPEGDAVYEIFKNASPQEIRAAMNQDQSQAFQASQGALNRQAQISAAKLAAGIHLEEKNQADLNALPAALKDYGSARTNMAVLDEALADPKAKHDVPGVGFLDRARTDVLHGTFAPEKDLRVAKAADQLQLAYRNLVTGSAASTEEDRRIAAAGIDRSSEPSFKTGYELLKQKYLDLLHRTLSSNPRAAQRFIAENPGYGIPGDQTFDPHVAKQGAAVYDAASPLSGLQPPVVRAPGHSVDTGAGQPVALDLSAPTTPAPHGAPPLPTATPVLEPARAAVGAKPKPTPADAAAVQWLASPEGKAAAPEIRAGVIKRLRAAGLL